MNLLFGTVLLAWILAFCAHILADVWAECRFQSAEAEREELLERLWADE